MKKKTIKQTDYRCGCCNEIKVGSNVKWVLYDKSASVIGICKACFFGMEKLGRIMKSPKADVASYVVAFREFMQILQLAGVNTKKFIGFGKNLI